MYYPLVSAQLAQKLTTTPIIYQDRSSDEFQTIKNEIEGGEVSVAKHYAARDMNANINTFNSKFLGGLNEALRSLQRNVSNGKIIQLLTDRNDYDALAVYDNLTITTEDSALVLKILASGRVHEDDEANQNIVVDNLNDIGVKTLLRKKTGGGGGSKKFRDKAQLEMERAQSQHDRLKNAGF